MRLPGLFQLLLIDAAVSTCQCCWFICYFIAFSCPPVLPNVCITYCNWSIFIPYFLITFFQRHLRNLNSLCVYFPCFWPQHYHLFYVFSIVNIYKTLYTLSIISLSVHHEWELPREEIMSECVHVLGRRVTGPLFSSLFLSLSLPKSPTGLETHKGTPGLSRGAVASSALYF